MDILNNIRMSNSSQSWEWLCFEITLRNASGSPISIVEYGIIIVGPDANAITAHPASYYYLPNGDTMLEDEKTDVRSAMAVHLTFLETPVNLESNTSASGWTAFHIDPPVSREIAENRPLIFMLVDHERRYWYTPFADGMGESRPIRRQSSFQLLSRKGDKL